MSGCGAPRAPAVTSRIVSDVRTEWYLVMGASFSETDGQLRTAGPRFWKSREPLARNWRCDHDGPRVEIPQTGLPRVGDATRGLGLRPRRPRSVGLGWH